MFPKKILSKFAALFLTCALALTCCACNVGPFKGVFQALENVADELKTNLTEIFSDNTPCIYIQPKVDCSKKELDSIEYFFSEKLSEKNIDGIKIKRKDNRISISLSSKHSHRFNELKEAVYEIHSNIRELRFTNADNTKTYLTGDDVVSAKVGMNENGKYIVNLTFTSEGGNKFAAATAELTGSNMCIYFGDEVISQPFVAQTITGTSASIEFFDTYDEAQAVADSIYVSKFKCEIIE